MFVNTHYDFHHSLMEKTPFCFAPWSNLDISPQGIIGPCCKFRHGYYLDPPVNIKDQDLKDYQQSKTLEIVRKDFLQGTWPLGCERCKIEEENGVPSKRQLDYDRWQQHYQNYDIKHGKLLTASVAFGNTCNLTCITCSPTASSRWQHEYLVLNNQNVPPNHFYKHDLVNSLLEMSPDIVHLDIPGGEPLLGGVPQQQELLQQLINKGLADRISLHYTTNVTIWPNQQWWNLWSNFREIDMQLSIDGIGAKFEYIRYPANWHVVLNNVQKYQRESQKRSNFRISVSHTVSAYNIYYLPEFLDWCRIQGLPHPWLGRVHDPIYMRPSVWSGEAKKHIINKLKNGGEDAQIWANFMTNTDDSNYFDLFCQRLAWHDSYRGLNFSNTFPEVARFI